MTHFVDPEGSTTKTIFAVIFVELSIVLEIKKSLQDDMWVF